MKTSDGFVIDENLLKKIGADTLKMIRTNSLRLEVEIATKLKDLEFLVVQGFSSDGYARARIDGNHHIIELDLDPTYSEWNLDKMKTCNLLTEAINDAIYKVDLAIETEIAKIKEIYINKSSGEKES